MVYSTTARKYTLYTHCVLQTQLGIEGEGKGDTSQAQGLLWCVCGFKSKDSWRMQSNRVRGAAGWMDGRERGARRFYCTRDTSSNMCYSTST